MAYEPRDNSGVLFKNDRKTKETQPDYKGNVLVNGIEMDIAAWIKEGKKGKFMSLSFQEKRQPQGDSMGEYQGEPAPRIPAPQSLSGPRRPAPQRAPSLQQFGSSGEYQGDGQPPIREDDIPF